MKTFNAEAQGARRSRGEESDRVFSAPPLRPLRLRGESASASHFIKLINRLRGPSAAAVFTLLFAHSLSRTIAPREVAQGATPETEARVAVVSLSPPRVKIEGARSSATKVWSFRDSYAGVMNLGGRIEDLSLADAQGADVPVRRLAAGEYEAAREAVRFSYEIRLDPPASNADASHVSWLTTDRGALMPGDLLPLPLARARISFKLPDGWKLVSPGDNPAQKGGGTKSAAPGGSSSLLLEDAESAILFAGLDVRERDERVSGMSARVAVAGEWAFTDEEIGSAVASILREHAKTFGGEPGDGALVVLAPPPRPATFSEWSAETRGSTVFCLAGRSPSRVSALARLETPLAHELFHLWVPNALKLAGDYAWFYEGFTNYQAMRASQRLGFLNFDDYLAALARAYDSYEPLREADTLSLVEASRRRWTGANALVYHKGMLAAAIYDLQLRAATRGRRSLDDVYRELFRRARARSGPRDGDALALDVLKNVAGGEGFAARLVAVPNRIDLGAELSTSGIKVETFGARHQLVVSSQLTGPQRDLLRQIGYNGK